MTIYQIKYRVKNAPHFFDRSSLKFFGQTLKDFKVKKLDNGKFYLRAPIVYKGRTAGKTERIFDPTTNCFE